MSKKKDTIACFQTSDIRQNVLAQIHRPQFGAAAMLVELCGKKIKKALDYLNWTNIYTSTFPSTLTPYKATSHKIRSGLSRTAVTLNFKLRWFPNQPRYWAEKLLTDTNGDPLMHD